MMIRTGRGLLLGALIFAGEGCGSSQPAKSAEDVQCPPGQSFDGQYCVVDQSVATKEQPAPAPAGAAEDPSEDSQSPSDTSGEGDNPVATEDTGEEVQPNSEPEVTEPVAADEIDLLNLPTAAPVDYAMAAQAAPVMHYLASSHLPAGARPLGTPFAGQFAQGQALTRKVNLTAGKCYTIVAMGLPPVTEVDIALIDTSTKEELVLDETTGPQAVIGSRDSCFRAEESKSVSLVVIVRAGQGIAAAQVFQK